MSALYQNHRPKTFDEVRGQGAITTTLKNQVISKRIAHAYLFCGVRGTGKTSVARILAKAVNCENPINGNPCGNCSTCKHIDNSLNIVEIDAASNNGVDDIRRLSEETKYRPTEGKYRVYIIDEVHMLSAGAFNALLKTLEEPPEYVIFILATTEKNKVPATIVSRCQSFDFRRISVTEITNALKAIVDSEGCNYEEDAIKHIARCADGSLRDALSILDRCMMNALTYEGVLTTLGAVNTNMFSAFFKGIINKDIKSLMELIETLFISGKDLNSFVNDFLSFLRNLMLMISGATVPAELGEEGLKNINECGKLCSLDVVVDLIKGFSEIEQRMKKAAQKRIILETYVIILTKKRTEEPEDVLRRIGNGQLINGQIVPVTTPPSLKYLMSLDGFKSFSKLANADFFYTALSLDKILITEQESVSNMIFKEEAGKILKFVPHIKTQHDISLLREKLMTEYKKYLTQNEYAVNGEIISCGYKNIDGQWVI